MSSDDWMGDLRMVVMRHGLLRSNLARDERAVSAVEFAVIAPFMILLLFGGYAATQAVAVSRKVTLTTRALADLASQYSTISSSDMAVIKNAATQIIAPFDATPLGLTISQVKIVSLLGVTIAVVDWTTSQGANAPTRIVGASITLPTGMPNTLGTDYILAETAYGYTPPFFVAGSKSWFFNTTYNLKDQIFMFPRVSSRVSYSGP